MSLWVARIELICIPKGGCSMWSQGVSVMGLCEGLELFIKLFHVAVIPFSCLENKTGIYLCPTLQSFPSVLQ